MIPDQSTCNIGAGLFEVFGVACCVLVSVVGCSNDVFVCVLLF
jgi:hypothetical protein